MATQKFSLLTLVFIALSLISHSYGDYTTGLFGSEPRLFQQRESTILVGKHPLTPPGKPAPDNSSSSGSTT